MKRKTLINVTIVFIVAIVASGIFGGIYFVSQLSSTYPPIAEYKFSKDIIDLDKSIINAIENDTFLKYRKTDTVGVINNYAYYMNITLDENTDSIEYIIKYGNNDPNKSVIKLIGAFDRLNNLGGYKAESEGVLEMVEIFEERLIGEIEK